MEDPVIKPLKRTMTESQLGNIEKAREKKSQYDAVRKEEAKIKRQEKNYEKMMDLLSKMNILNPPAPPPPEAVAPPVSQLATPVENAKVVIKKSKKRAEHIMKTVPVILSDTEDETATETDGAPPPPPPPILKEKRPRPVPVVNVSKRQIIFG